MSEQQNNIPLLNPVLFTQELIEKSWDLENKLSLNDFFIHSFKDHVVPLKLPLPLHKKTVNDFVLVIDGKMTKTIGLDSFPLERNQFLFTPKNSITTTKDVSDDLEGFYCHFSNDFIANNPFLRQWTTQPISQNLLSLKEDEIQILLPLLKRIVKLYREIKENPRNYQLIHYYLSTFFAEISLFAEKKTSKVKTHPLVLSFQQLVYEKFKESKSVQFYADLLHVTPNHLNKIVKLETGKTASNFIYNICILEAKVLLLQTDLSISQVAYELGYEDTSYFSRFFKKYTNTSPSDFKKND